MASASSQVIRRVVMFRLIDPIWIGLMIAGTWYLRDDFWPSLLDWLSILAVMVWTAVSLHVCGAYEVMVSAKASTWCQRLLVGLLVGLGGVLLVAYGLKVSESISRTVVGSTLAGSFVGLCGIRLLAHQLALRRFRHGEGVDPVILVGEPQHALSFSRHLKRHPELGLKPVAIISGEIDLIEGQTQTTVLNGSIDDLPSLVDKHQARRVIICGELGDQRTIVRCLQLLSGQGVDIHYAPDYSAVPIFIFRANDFAGRPVIDISSTPWSDADRMVKFLEDKIVAAVILVVISPLLLLVAAAIKLTSPGPVLFRQDRHGFQGRPFRVWKFRTMKMEALQEAKPPTPLPVSAADLTTESDIFDPISAPTESSFRQAVTNDPRITPIGRFLRNTSLDELPQFLNVLMGDMSIVGPRPHAVAHNRQYIGSIAELMRRHHVKPGITGLAQISGSRGQTPNTQSMRDRLRFDLEYIHTWSLWLDVKIIFMTIFKGFFNHQP